MSELENREAKQTDQTISILAGYHLPNPHGVGHREIARREDSRNLGDCAHDVSLWVRMRRQIARSRADFLQFSEMSDKRETGWWSGMDSNFRYRFLNWRTTAFGATFAASTIEVG
jgi:hypothetical protein